MDRLIDAISETHNPSVVGIDPTPQLIPQAVTASMVEDAYGSMRQSGDYTDLVPQAMAMSYFLFGQAIIDAVAGIVPAVKPQIAMYEALGAIGVSAYNQTCRYAQEQGLYVIGDIKRADIGTSAAHYAHHLSGISATLPIPEAPAHTDPWHEDAVTVNPYLGADAVKPFLDAAEPHDKDVFCLVHTSNPSATQIQDLQLANGQHVYEHVGMLVDQQNRNTTGLHGYGRLGAVVGATYPAQGRALRARMPHTFFLIPGYGAQGGTATDIAAMADEHGSGIIVNSSRAIIGAWKRRDHTTMRNPDEALAVVMACARDAAIDMRDNLRAALT